MAAEDARGAAVTGANPRSTALFETGVAELNCYIGDPVARVDQALSESPGFAMAHILKAYLLIASMEPAQRPIAAAAASHLAALPLNGREQAHAAAVHDLLKGEAEAASQRLDAILIDHPTDILALQFGHLLDLGLGDSRNLRDRVTRVLGAWDAAMPGYHAVLSMRAMGLEEMGDYARAEEEGRAAAALNPRDGWAYHAVAHVMEMTGRAAEGAAWLHGHADRWAPGSFFAVHNWWHLALFRLEQDDIAGALSVFDGGLEGGESPIVMDMVDAAALLWRLRLRGADVGDRWLRLALRWAPHVGDGCFAFGDAHAMMTFIGAGWAAEQQALLAVLARTAQLPGTNGAATRLVALPLAQALLDFDAGRHEAAAESLWRLRGIAHRFGGSHAQRDVIDLTLIEAARRAGRRPLVRALADERLDQRPLSPLARRYRAALSAGAAAPPGA